MVARVGPTGSREEKTPGGSTTSTVQIPVSSVAWVPETRMVQAPTTTYRTVMAETRVPLYATPATGALTPPVPRRNLARARSGSGPTRGALE